MELSPGPAGDVIRGHAVVQPQHPLGHHHAESAGMQAIQPEPISLVFIYLCLFSYGLVCTIILICSYFDYITPEHGLLVIFNYLPLHLFLTLAPGDDYDY